MVNHMLVSRPGAPGYLTPPPSLAEVDADRLFEVGRLAPAGGDAALDGMLDVISLLGRAAILLDSVGDVLCMNAEAEVLYPTALGRRQGRLFALDRMAEPRFRALVAGATSPSFDQERAPALVVRLPRHDCRSPLVARAHPLARVVKSGFGQATAMLCLINPDRRNSVDSEMLQITFGLTWAEARLAGILANGTDLFEAANRLRISRSTTRSHLRSIFAKTGTRRQGELVALLARVAG